MPRTPKAFCKRGHLRSPENLRTRIDKFGRSFSACRLCLAIYAKDYARLHRKSRKRSTFTLGYRKSELKLKPITGIGYRSEGPIAERGGASVDTSGLRDLIHELTYRLGLNDGDYVHPAGRNNLPKPTKQARARSDDDPYLKLRAVTLLQALEDFARNPNDAELRSFFFSGIYWNCFRIAQFESPDDGDGVESPMKSIRAAYDFWFEDEGDGPLSLANLCDSLGLSVKAVRMRLAQALGGKDLRHQIAFATAAGSSRKAARHDPQPKPWHKVEAHKYAAPDRNISNPWSVHFESPWVQPESWNEIFREFRPSASELKEAIIRSQNRIRTARWRARQASSQLSSSQSTTLNTSIAASTL